MLRNTRLYPCIALTWILGSFIAHRPAVALDCDNAFDLEANIVWRDNAHLEEPTFRWWLPSPGIASVDLLATGSDSSWIDFRAGACDGPAADVLVIEHSVRRLVLAVRSAGQLHLTIGARSSAFRLITSFTQAEVVENAFGLGDQGMRAVQTSFLVAGLPEKTEPEILDPDPDAPLATVLKTEPEILDPDPDAPLATVLKTEPEILDPDPDAPLAKNERLVASLLTLERVAALKNEPETLDPDPDAPLATSLKTEPEILDPDPDTPVKNSARGISPARRQMLLFEPICRRTELDDHGDTISCATSLTFGRGVTGELANDWNDDRDVFSFRLDRVSTVEIVLVAEASGLSHELSGPTGQRLAMDRLWTDDATTAHLVSTLAPGRYFFHVTGASGAFAITTVTSD